MNKKIAKLLGVITTCLCLGMTLVVPYAAEAKVKKALKTGAIATTLKEGYYHDSEMGEDYMVYVKDARSCVVKQSNGGYEISDLPSSNILADAELMSRLKPKGSQKLKFYEDADIKKCLSAKGTFHFTSRGEFAEEIDRQGV